MSDDYISDDFNDDEPIIEQLEKNDEEIQPEAEKTLDDYNQAYRKQVPYFPLDHAVRCMCGWHGKVGSRQLFCLKCHEPLIPPDEVEEDD